MYLSALTALNRKDGKLVILASVAYPAAGRDTAKVAAAYNELVAGTKAGAEKRAKYSHIMLMIENQVRNTHQFPDLAAEAVKQEARLSKTEAAEKLARVKTIYAETERLKAEVDAKFENARQQALELGIIKDDVEVLVPEVIDPVIAAAKELRQKATALLQTAQDAQMAADGAIGQANHDHLVKTAAAALEAAAQADNDATQAESALQ